MLEKEFREKFTERFNLLPDEVIPEYVLKNVDMIPVDKVELTPMEKLWLKKIVQKLYIGRAYSEKPTIYNLLSNIGTTSGRHCSRHSQEVDCDLCYRGAVLNPLPKQ